MQPASNLLKPRRPTRAIFVGNVQVGGGAPVSVQSMTNTDTCNIDATLAQIERLVKAGCEIVRLAVPNKRGGQGLWENQGRLYRPAHCRHSF